jgi:integrase
MARKNSPNHGSLNQARGRYYYLATLPGTNKRKSYPLVPAGRTKSTVDKREAIALANEMWDRASSAAALEGEDADYDGTLPTLKELFLKEHEKELAEKDIGVQKKEMRFYRAALNDLISFFKTVPFSLVTFDLKPNRLLLWRKFLHGENEVCRSTINKKVNVVKQMIQYAVNREIEPAQLVYEVTAIKPIKKGQENFMDHDEVGPVDWPTVEKIFPYVDSMIQDMLLIIRYTGARPGEVRLMRPCDIDCTDSQAWVFSLKNHKTRRHGLHRNVVIGPDAQAILLRYMVRMGNAYCFPARSNNHGDVGPCYDSGSFAKVITRAVTAYNKEHPKTPISFHANQLRHTFATSVCLERGLEVTRCALGHSTTQMTKRYARQALEADQLKSAKLAVQKIG